MPSVALKFAGTDVAKGIGQGLSESNAQVTAALYRAGYTASQAAQAVKAWSNAGINDIAAGLQTAGASVDQVVAAAKDAYGNCAATAYNGCKVCSVEPGLPKTTVIPRDRSRP